MITDSEWYPAIKTNRNYVFLLEHLEPAMEKEQLNRVIEKHNAGMNYKLIAKQERRHPVEIIVALLHQITTRKGQGNRGSIEVKRPFAQLL